VTADDFPLPKDGIDFERGGGWLASQENLNGVARVLAEPIKEPFSGK